MRMRFWLLWLCGLLSPTVAAERLPRVASINLCADQILIAIAAPGQIVSLGPFARDRRLSFMAAAAEALPINTGAAESVLAGKPDLVLAGSFDNAATRRLLASTGTPLHILPPWGGFAAGSADIRALARAIGRVEAGERLIDAIEAARQAAQGRASGRTALVLGRGAYIDVSASLVHDLVRAVGLAPLVTVADGGAGRFMPLEEVITLRPDVLVLGEGSREGADRRAALFSHPAFRRAFPPAGQGGPRRITLPERLTACGGPGLVEALRHMAEALR